ncbi:MAG: S46 family peptidase, partial [Bacteroidota bacterium]
MKKILCILFLLSTLTSRADEGMWIPMLLGQSTYDDMVKKGLKLSSEDIYNINQASLKDAIVLFGGGCTAEVISEQGLLITNHHCGYGEIQSHSTVEKDYLLNGFWAMSKEEELPNDDLTVSFLIRMEDVSKTVLENVKDDMSEADRDKVIQEAIKKIEKEAVKGTHYEARVRPFYYGSEYYLFVMETFSDVRLVGAPPTSIGSFGGDTDNWVWPRHTGDFSMFRIYADKDNKPAKYSKDNVPYKPKKSLTISLKGVKKGDFTMVYGFPGRTQEYLTSWAVDLIANTDNPIKVSLRTKRLEIMGRGMNISRKVKLQYASKYNGVANAWKKWDGEM